MQRGRPLVLVLLLSSFAAAQNYTVSPDVFAGVAGNRPFVLGAGTVRMQHIQTDQVGRVLALQGITMRRFAGYAASPMPARTIDAELVVAEADLATATATFAANYRSQPFPVIPRTLIQLPDLSQPQGSPEPWSVQLPFTTPFVYVGVLDLLWELAIYSSSVPGTYLVDGAAPIPIATAELRRSGAGCQLGGSGSASYLSGTAYAATATQNHEVSFVGRYLPASTPVSVLVGLQNPRAVIPGLCATVFVLPLLALATVSGQSGDINGPWLRFRYDPALAGVSLFVQAAAFDAGQPGIPLLLTPGIEFVLPPMPLAVLPGRTLVASGAYDLTGVQSLSIPIVRFRH